MSLESIELPPELRTKLYNEGIETIEELKKVNVVDLSKGFKLSKEEIIKVLKITRGEVPVLSGKNMLEFISEDDGRGITLSSKNLDALFENGIPVRRLTELCGESGSGKTQICMQLAVNVQRPKEQGGLDGECIYIDTEGSFLSHRLIKMINDEDILPYLNKIHLFRAHSHAELIALIRQLPDILAQSFQKKVKLIIVDSIAYHFRMNTMQSRRRDMFLPNLAHSLIRIATDHRLAVVVTNHVTENITDGTWIPALGTAWGNWCAFGLFLFRRRQYRFGYLHKSIDDRDSTPVKFCIKKTGIADPEHDDNDDDLPNDQNDTQIVKSDDIWSQHLFIDDEDEEEKEKVNNNTIHERAESSKSANGNAAPPTETTSEESPSSNGTNNMTSVSISNNKITLRDKGKRKLVVDEEVPVKMAASILKVETIENIETLHGKQEQVPTNKRREKKQKPVEKEEVPQEPVPETNIPDSASTVPVTTRDRKRKIQNKSLPASKKRNGKKLIQNESVSDWSESDIEDDLEFLAHFEDAF